MQKRITGSVAMKGQEAPSRARQIIQANDVLVSTVRPNLNAVAIVGPELDGATASTGFSILRPSDRVDAKYLFHWVRTPDFVLSMVRKATGASYPAVSDRIVKESTIPLPPIDEQRRIAAVLDQADAIRSKHHRVVTHLAALAEAIFMDMFGDPDVAIALGSSVRFGDVADLQGGRNLVADDQEAASEFRVLKISAVTSGQFRATESKTLPSDYKPPYDHVVRQGDLLISRANTSELVGAVAYVEDVPPNLVLPDKIWRFVWRNPESVPLYYRSLFRTASIRRRISQLSSGTGGSMKNISKAKLVGLELPDVAIRQQREFARRISIIPRPKLTEFDELFASLQSRAFSGRL